MIYRTFLDVITLIITDCNLWLFLHKMYTAVTKLEKYTNKTIRGIVSMFHCLAMQTIKAILNDSDKLLLETFGLYSPAMCFTCPV
jgi:hypothetical protein